MTAPPLLHVRPGRLGVRPVEACGAPGGIRAWITRTIAKTGLTSLPFVDDELEMAVSNIVTGPDMTWSPPAAKDRSVPTRLARVRYRFLASHYKDATETQYDAGPPDDPRLLVLWNRVQRAKKNVEDLERRLVVARKNASDTWADFAEAQVAVLDPAFTVLPTKRGAKGNPHHREPVRALVRIFRDLFGVEPRRSDEGPVVRFASAFFGGLEGEWFWLDAERFEPSQRHERMRKFNEKLASVRPPRTTIPDIVRHAIAAEREGRPSERWEDGPDLYSGYFVRLWNGEAELPLEPAKIPLICRLLPQAETRYNPR